MQEWISVKEKLPEDGWKKEQWWQDGCDGHTMDEFLVTVRTNDISDDPEVCIATYMDGRGFYYSCELSKKYDGDPWFVTHWMPLPELPTH